jgi:hypothetical protein
VQVEPRSANLVLKKRRRRFHLSCKPLEYVGLVRTTSAGIWLLGTEERGSATSSSLETSLGMVRGNPKRCRVFLLCVRFSLRRRIACLGWRPPQPMPRAASEDRPCMHEPTVQEPILEQSPVVHVKSVASNRGPDIHSPPQKLQKLASQDTYPWQEAASKIFRWSANLGQVHRLLVIPKA